VAEALRRDGMRATPRVCDLADREALARTAADVARVHGALEGLVHCAGVSVTGELESADLAHWERLFAVNFWGPCA
jgi:NAD(P)-dependent dehydrogenase (short-subunit alcohol dehydrogenase family)